MIRAFIFDMDGVIVDSEGIMTPIIVKMLKNYGITISEEDLRKSMGQRLDETVLRIAEEQNKTIDIDEFMEKRDNLYKLLAKDKLKIFPEAVELIKKLKEQNFLVAVSTSGNRIKANINVGIAQIKDYLDAVTNGDEVEHSKPDPHIYSITAEKLQVPPEDCIVIEDTPNGITAAKRAGMKCIGITNSFSKDKLEEADIIVDNLNEININEIN
ncbi:HAD family hydrolase [Nanoarchaeota archaeon]